MDEQSKFHNAIENKINENYPHLNINLEKYKNVFSNNEIVIQKRTLDQIQSFINSIFKISRHKEFQQLLFEKYSSQAKYINQKASNYSVLMSYDFHIINDEAKLIEINTNASSYTIGDLIYQTKTGGSHLEKLKISFESDMQNFSREVKNIAIIDEQPNQQNLYLEFLIYKEIFTSWGYNCSINDVNELRFKDSKVFDKNGDVIDFIYNRFCDFYLSQNDSKKLSSAYLNNEIILSPQPLEYFLLADKQRMIDWQSFDLSPWCEPADLDILNKTLLKTKNIQSFQADELWSIKKQYFFKPKSSFGGKSVYRGKNVTKKVFQRLITEETLVQELAPAPKIEINEQLWKYDIRVYCYKNNIDQIVARTYRGQTTNASTPGGGISLVKVI